MTKRKRHHNNTGWSATQNGKRHFDVAAMAKRMGLPFVVGKKSDQIRGEHPDWETKGHKTRAEKWIP